MMAGADAMDDEGAVGQRARAHYVEQRFKRLGSLPKTKIKN
jgi:hypothetical protein